MVVDIIIYRSHRAFSDRSASHAANRKNAMLDVVKIGDKLLLYHGDNPPSSLINTWAVEKPMIFMKKGKPAPEDHIIAMHFLYCYYVSIEKLVQKVSCLLCATNNVNAEEASSVPCGQAEVLGTKTCTWVQKGAKPNTCSWGPSRSGH